jgi:hypothetical protein
VLIRGTGRRLEIIISSLMICNPHRITFGGKIEEEQMGFTCNTQGEKRNTPNVSVGNSKEIEHLADLDVDGNITTNLKRSIIERARTEIICLRIGTSGLVYGTRGC